MLLALENPEVGSSEALKPVSALFRPSLAGPCREAEGPHGRRPRDDRTSRCSCDPTAAGKWTTPNAGGGVDRQRVTRTGSPCASFDRPRLGLGGSEDGVSGEAKPSCEDQPALD
jgi:hypothetical protein